MDDILSVDPKDATRLFLQDLAKGDGVALGHGARETSYMFGDVGDHVEQLRRDFGELKCTNHPTFETAGDDTALDEEWTSLPQADTWLAAPAGSPRHQGRSVLALHGTSEQPPIDSTKKQDMICLSSGESEPMALVGVALCE